MDVSRTCMADASPLMQPDFVLFDDAIIKSIQQRWMSYGNNAELHNNLFRADVETRETTLSCLQSMCQSTIRQLEANSADYLPGGCHYELLHKSNLSAAEEAKLSLLLTIALTTDLMEQVYSHLDHDASSQLGLALGTAAGKTAFRVNKTMEWYKKLSLFQQIKSCDLMRRLYFRTHAEVKEQYKDARAVRRGHVVAKTDHAAERRRTLIKAMIKYEGVTIFFAVRDWRDWLEEMRRVVTKPKVRERSHLSKMSEQFNCLRYRCGVRFIHTHTTREEGVTHV